MIRHWTRTGCTLWGVEEEKKKGTASTNAKKENLRTGISFLCKGGRKEVQPPHKCNRPTNDGGGFSEREGRETMG